MFSFLAPTTLDEALRMLGEKEDVRILAGGTDVIVLLRAGAISCQHMMDVKLIPELNVFGYTNDGLEIGGAVTCNQLIEADFLDEAHDVLRQAAETLANTLLRNRATIIGNLCNASPGGDMIPAALALDARLVAASTAGQREIPLKDFFTGVKKHVLKPDELVVKMIVPRQKGRGAYLKKRRIRGHDLAQVGVAAFYGEDGALRIAAGAVGPTPVLVEDFGTMTAGRLKDEKEDIIKKVEGAVSPIGDVRSSKEYREAMLRLFTGRLVDAFADGTEVAQ